MPQVVTTRRRQLAALAAAVALAATHLTPSGASGAASAEVTATARTTLTVTVTTWRAAPAPPSLPHPGTPLALAWTTRAGEGVATFDVVNVGRLPLARQTIRVRTADGDPTPDPIVLTACVGGVWDANGEGCPGDPLELGVHDDGPVTTGVTLAAGERLSVRAVTRRRTAARADVQVDVAVSRADVAAPAGD